MSSSSSLQQFRVQPSQKGTLLLAFVKECLGLSGSKSKALLDKRAVWVNGKRVWMAKHALSVGDQVEIRVGAATTKVNPDIEILFQDQWILAVNKPAGMISESHKQSVESLLRSTTSNPQLRALHRLDKDTSGVLLFTKTSSIRESFIECFREKTVHKSYAVLLAGALPADPKKVSARVDGQDAQSIFSRETIADGFCRATCQILTGRTHQIRKHAGVLSCRVLGDKHYTKGPPISQKEKQVPRQMLHAEHIRFTSPPHGQDINLHAPWPQDFRKTAKEFRL